MLAPVDSQAYRGNCVKRFQGALAVFLLLFAMAAPGAIVIIGDVDGFGHNFCGSTYDCNPGDPFPSISDTFGSQTLSPPGFYVDAAGMDKRIVGTRNVPNTGYQFRFDFSWNTVGLASITSAEVFVQAGSVGRRADGSGFGYADVKIVNAHGVLIATLSSDFLGSTTFTVREMYSEEQVRGLSFNVQPYLTPGTTGTLYFLLDGSGEIPIPPSLPNPNEYDRFALDFAELSFSGAAVPVPAAVWLFLSAVGAMAATGHKKYRVASS